MTTRTIFDVKTGRLYEEELSAEEIEVLEANRQANQAWEEEQWAKREAYNAKRTEVEQLQETIAASELSEAEVAALPAPMQKVYRLIEWLIESKRLDEMDRGGFPFDTD